MKAVLGVRLCINPISAPLPCNLDRCHNCRRKLRNGSPVKPWSQNTPRGDRLDCTIHSQGYVHRGSQTVVRVWSGEQIPAPLFNLNLTSILPLFALILPLLHLLLLFFINLTVW